MTKFMVKLKASGYDRNQRWEILKSGTRRYNRLVEEERKGIRRVNRPRWEGGGRRYVNKLLQKKNWYKRRKKDGKTEEGKKSTEVGKRHLEGGGGTQYGGDHSLKRGDCAEQEAETVMFIPSTPRGELMRAMKEADINFRKGTKIKPIKFVERAGVSMTDMLVESNPWGDMVCGRNGCFICRGEKGGIKHCMKEEILYKITCEECKGQERQVEYWGETGRDGFARGGEHLKGCKEKDKENAL